MFRFFTVYGPFGRPDMALFKFTKAILNEEVIDVYNNGKMCRDFTFINDLCQAVVARGATVFLRGQCPQDLDTAENIDSHDPVKQTHKVMQNIQQLISEAGGKMEDMCKVVVYITDTRHREAVYRTMGEYLKGIYPVSTGLCVTALARPEWLVEIDATFVIPD